ncbi:hypothetical protein [Pseudomonas petrae]|uniref:hypothetical protein n=1 Tax=Pseudomonas petrae TaxID=2912190 RepID=UPI001F34C29D|nr:hypothetical protein [Pseudomonas petrae]MCF7536269.1 hypothetical protein [Pseudomonas petrae]
MSQFKASTRLTEINAEQIEQLRREYNEISVSKFSLSDAFKQHLFHNRSFVIIAKNCHSIEFGKYNQTLANLYTNLSQIKSAVPETNKNITIALRTLLKMKLDVSRLRFKTLEINTATKPDFESLINLPLFEDSHSPRKNQYTISLTENEHKEYQDRFANQDLVKLLFEFFDAFTVYEKEFINSSIEFADNNKLRDVGVLANKYVLDKKQDESTIRTLTDFVHNYGAFHKKLISGSNDLLAFIDGAK